MHLLSALWKSIFVHTMFKKWMLKKYRLSFFTSNKVQWKFRHLNIRKLAQMLIWTILAIVILPFFQENPRKEANKSYLPKEINSNLQ